MTEAIRVATIGPSGTGKTTLVSAVLDDAQRLLGNQPVSMVATDETAALMHQNRDEVRAALAMGEFVAGLRGTQEIRHYRLALRAGFGRSFEVPFNVLDYPGGWMSPEYQARNPEVALDWEACQEHIADSVMMLLPIDAAIVMEARQEAQRRAARLLLELSAVEELVRDWAKYRVKAPDEPAVLVLAPLKCEKYFRDGPRGSAATLLERRVREEYGYVLRAVREVLDGDHEDAGQPTIRIIYAPVDTYGCVELIEADWIPNPRPGMAALNLEGHYRVLPPGIQQVRAAGVIVQELCQCILDMQIQQAAEAQAREFSILRRLRARHAERKGFWGTIKYHFGSEATRNRVDRDESQAAIDASAAKLSDLNKAVGFLARMDRDERVRIWEDL